jgi:hypothetical protein
MNQRKMVMEETMAAEMEEMVMEEEKLKDNNIGKCYHKYNEFHKQND